MIENVKRGIELLDRKAPGWRDRIKPNGLKIIDCNRCTLGQLFGDYNAGLKALGLDDFDSSSKSEYYGFTVRFSSVGVDDTVPDAFERLEAEWKRQLKGE